MRVDEVLAAPPGPPLDPDEAELDFTNNVEVDQALILVTVLVGCALVGVTVFKAIPIWMGLAGLPALFGGCVLCWWLRYQHNRDKAVAEAQGVKLELTGQLDDLKLYLSRLTAARAELAAAAGRQRGLIEEHLRNARGSRALILQMLGGELDGKATQVRDTLDLAISQLEDGLRRVAIDPRVDTLAKREASERARRRRLERMLQSLSGQLAEHRTRMSFWRYLRRIERSG
jgi:hypothetical protein